MRDRETERKREREKERKRQDRDRTERERDYRERFHLCGIFWLGWFMDVRRYEDVAPSMWAFPA